MNDLTITERDQLGQHEVVIERGLTTFVEVGEALAAIRDARLYRADYATFEDYCRKRWTMSDRRARQMIDAARVVSDFGTTVPVLPANEAQARPLAGLPPDVRRGVWQRAVDTASDGKVTAAHVERVADEYEFNRQQIMEANRAGYCIEVPQTQGASQPVEVTIFSHKTVEYYTPPEFLEAARAVLGEIDLDPASCPDAQQNVMATAYYTKEQDGLAQPWYGRVYLNPPYSKTDGRSNQETWSTRLVTEYQSGNVTAAVLLVKAALGYNWFERLWYDWPVCFVRSRLSFIQEDGDSDGQSKQGTAFLYLGPDIERFIEVFREFGRVILPTDGYSTLR